MNTIYLNGNDETAKAIAKVAFPAYNGKKFKVSVVKNGHTFNLTSGWCEGSRDFYAVVDLANMKGVDVSNQAFVGNDFNRRGTDFQLPEGFAVVEHSIFCGKDVGITIYVTEANAAKLIPAPVELTREEKIVLAATRSLKSTYMGRTRQMESGLSLAVWNATSDALKLKGLLAKNGAITPEGKNAIGFTSLHSL